MGISTGTNIKRGDIIEFKRRGFVSAVLGWLLKRIEKDYDGYGWHTAIAWQPAPQGWYILEAIQHGVTLNWYTEENIFNHSRVWTWLKEEPDPVVMSSLLPKYLYKKYDVAIYFWTAVAVIFRHYFNRPIPKLLDNRFDCWELIQEFTMDMEDPILSRYDVIIITDLVKALNERKGTVMP